MQRPPIYSDVVVVAAQDVTGHDASGQDASSHDPGVIVRVGGRYSFKNWYGSNGKLRQFSGRIVEISSHVMVLTAPVVGKTGICATVKCDEFGQWRGIVSRPTSHGFAIEIAANADERAKLADKILWHKKVETGQTTDKRKHKRIEPHDPLSTLTLADGRCLRCFVIDMSVSGAAVSADIFPAIGMPLAVGKIIGRVVRHFAGGFAVKFVEPQNIGLLERMIIQAPQ